MGDLIVVSLFVDEELCDERSLCARRLWQQGKESLGALDPFEEEL